MRPRLRWRHATRLANGLQCRLGHAGDDAAPAGMRRGHRVTRLEENGQTIGAGDRQRQAARHRYHCIAFGLEARRRDANDARPMDLSEGDESSGSELQRAQQTAAVLRHCLGPVGGGAAEIQSVERRRADAASPGGKRPLGGGRAVMAPHRNQSIRVEAPHAGDHRNRVGERQASPAFRMGDSW